MKRSAFRWLPIAATLGLLLLALFGPVTGAGAKSAAASSPPSITDCEPIQQGDAGSVLVMPSTTGISQPFAANANAAACTIGLGPPGYASGRLDVVAWDPNTLAPAPHVVALRSRYFNVTALSISHVAMYFDPPLIGRSVKGMAEPAPEFFSLDYRNNFATTVQTTHYQPSGSTALPAAMSIPSNASDPRTPLPGTHPVLSHHICGGDASLQDLHVVQNVIRTNTVVGGPDVYQVAQRFRVPVATRLHWIEFAPQEVQGATYPIAVGSLMVLDAEGSSVLPASLPPALVQANFARPSWLTPAWQAHYDFDQQIVLEAEHDYWIVIFIDSDYTLAARMQTESPDFQPLAGIGPLVLRAAAEEPWTEVPGTDLGFRVVGEVLEPASVDPLPGSSFRLAISPVPSRGPVRVAWAGASGPVRFSVLDARGRRVAGGEGAGTREGEWMWSGRGLDGAPLPAGVYFVRGLDATGRTASERVVLVQ